MFEERAPTEKKIDQSTVPSTEPAALLFEWNGKDLERKKKMIRKIMVVGGGGWRGDLKLATCCCSLQAWSSRR